MEGMVPTVVVLNGGSSSGKSSLTRELQPLLPGTWLRFSVDTLIDACPPQLLSQGGLDIAANGSIDVGEAFTRIEQCWMAGLAAMARDRRPPSHRRRLPQRAGRPRSLG